MVEQLRIEARDMTFGALAWGEPTDPLALCVHGYPDTAWTWRHLGPALAGRGWRVVAPFTRGYGPTDLAPDGDYSVGAQSGDLLAIAEALGADRRAVLVGHDWGAVAAYAVTAQAPSRFARVAVLAVPPMGAVLDLARRTRTLPLLGRQARKSWYMGFNQLPLIAEGGQDRLIPRLWRDWSPGYDATEDLEGVFDALRGPGRRRAATRYYRSVLRRAGFHDAFRVVPRQPALFLFGADDGCVDPEVATLGAGLLAAGSRSERVEGAGHFLHLEQPEVVHRLVADWLDPAQRS